MVATVNSLYGNLSPFVDASLCRRNPNLKEKAFFLHLRGGGRKRVETRYGIVVGNDHKGSYQHRLLPFAIKTDRNASAIDDSDEWSDEEENDSFEEELRKEREMREKVKKMEEREELEKQAEELQASVHPAAVGDETEEEKRQRIRKELEKLAKEQAERRGTAKLMYEFGQRAYGKGNYGKAIEFFEAALTIIPQQTLLGGEIQIWLAIAYDANNRHRDCITLYRQLENKHPNALIQRQAAGLRYILQAPKLRISEEEMVTIPLIGSSYDRYAGTWSDKYKDKGRRRRKLPSRKDYLADFLVWRPPVGWERSSTFWAYVTLSLGLVGVCLWIQI